MAKYLRIWVEGTPDKFLLCRNSDEVMSAAQEAWGSEEIGDTPIHMKEIELNAEEVRGVPVVVGLWWHYGGGITPDQEHAHCWHTLVPGDPHAYETNEGFEERCCWCGQTRTVQGVSFQAPTSEPHGQATPRVELVRPN
jgi:hypothetical protein